MHHGSTKTVRPISKYYSPRGGGVDSLLVSDERSDILWVCETLSSIPFGTLFGA